MAAKLNQIIALVNGKKTRAEKALTEIYHNLKKPTMFEGINRTYQPVDENGETQPPENKQIQYRVNDAIKAAREVMVDMLDVTLTQDIANTRARADVVVDGKTVLKNVPVTYLLFLEKQLINLHTFVGSLPTLDPADRWSYSEESDCYVSERTFRNSTKKVMRNHEKAPATDRHPAQVEVYTEDVKVGEWNTIKFSGAITAKKKNDLVYRVERLQEAVKMAREEANNMEVESAHAGEAVFSHIFG